MRSVSVKSRREDQRHILYSIAFFSENRVFFEIMWKNMVEPDRTQTIYGACVLHAG